MADNGAKNTVKRLAAGFKPYRGQLAAALILAAVYVSATLYAPIITGSAIDLIIGKGNVDLDGLLPLLARFAVVIVIAAVSQYFMSLFLNKVTFSALKDLRDKAFDNLSRQLLKYIDSHPKGDIISRLISDTDQISDGLIAGFAQFFTGIITILGTLAFMLAINVKIALIVVLLTPISLFMARYISKNTFKFFKEQTAVRGDVTSFIEEMTGNQKTVKEFGHEKRAQEDFERLNLSLQGVSVRAIFFSSITNPSTRFVNGLVYTSVGVIGALSVMAGHFSVGQLSCFLTYAKEYTKPFNEISGVITELTGALACAGRVFELIDRPPEPNDSGAHELCGADGTLKAEQVCFSYDPNVPLIEGFSLDVKSGSRIAIVGPTGCGKTTFINLLMRFYEPNSGRILISGIPAADCTRDSVRKSFGMVLQDTWLKTGTVRDNISYGRPDAEISEIEAAARAAHCDGFIRRLEKGYDTVISDESSTLSAGQKQLLCIARIMLSLPPMLILDEATSSIDTRTELLIQEAFGKMTEGRTSFIIAHRLSTVRDADLILVMDKGQIVEQGDHDTLMQKRGFYARLYNSQFVGSEK